ncbi:poz/btb kelch domain protein [Raccoonpox virus]|uniref:Kelch repeat protein C2 n=1 Tax=Raccoon poxvirus TaxID=10256 RepID=A0A0G3G483_RACVI|nr:POZ/BTB Kelch-like protein [Raccoonpox virus]AKJ93656.1 POZ/BTB Kelch-like protein [Raccoonpox virus]AOP31287.1 poz/btb kelch domain protein [Raccoonpox virus]
MENIIFSIDGKIIQVNKKIIMESPYNFFKNIQNIDEVITLKGINYHAFESLLDYIHWKKINITINNVEMILVAAITLDVPPVVDLCVKTMIRNINSNNCIHVFNFSNRYGIDKLYKASMLEIVDKIITVTSFPEFYKLSKEDLTTILSHADVNINHEDVTAMILLKWINKNPKDRDIINILYPKFMTNNMRKAISLLGLNISPSTSRITRNGIQHNVIAIKHSDHRIATITHYSPRTKHWNTMGNIDRQYYNANVLHNCLYITGGMINNRRMYTVIILDLKTKKMKNLTNMSSLKSEVSTCVNDGKLYVIGGLEFSISTGTVEYLKHDTTRWIRLPNLITPRYSGASVFVNDDLYVIGGVHTTYDRYTVLNSVECFTKNRWIKKSPMPRRHSIVYAVEYDGDIYVITGISHEIRNHLYKYIVNEDKWIELYMYFNYVGKIFMCSCTDYILIIADDRYEYYPKSNTWNLFNMTTYNIDYYDVFYNDETPKCKVTYSSLSSFLRKCEKQFLQ